MARRSLRSQLLRTHLGVAGLGLAILLVVLLGFQSLRSRSLRLATESGPAAVASQRLEAGIGRSAAALRGWVVLGDPSLLDDNRAIWEQRMRPALAELRALNPYPEGSKDHGRLADIERHLDDLAEWQWYIADAAWTPGNEPARHLYETRGRPAFEDAARRIDALVEHALATGPAADADTIRALDAFASDVLAARAALVEHLDGGAPATADAARRSVARVQAGLAALGERFASGPRDVLALLPMLARDARAIASVTERVLALRAGDDWNVAEHLLASRAGPLADGIEQDAALFSSYLEQGWRDDSHHVLQESQLVLELTTSLLLLMVGVAYLESRRGAGGILHQVTALVRGARDLEEGRLLADLAVTSDDELGDLTESFNRMRRSLQDSERRLHERNAELAQLNASLRASHRELESTQVRLINAAKLESVGRLAAGVAHEVKNPLGIVLGAVEFLERRLAAADAAVRDMLREITEAVGRANTVVRGLLDFSVPSAVALRPGCVNTAIEHALVLVQSDLAHAHVTLERELDPDPPDTSMDEQKLVQVLLNLCLNAAHAMEGGGVLTIRSGARVVRAGEAGVGESGGDVFQPGQTVVVVEVDDTGPGIPEHDLADIFEPFYTTKPAGKGTGLGLPVSRQIMTLHGGTLELVNRAGGGARARLVFPARFRE